MSHTAKIKVEFRDLESLKDAFHALGWEIHELAKIRSYGGLSPTLYPFVALNPETVGSSYDVGIDAKGEELALYCDFWGGSIEKQLGKSFSKLKQEYAFNVMEKHFAYFGASVQREINQDGSQTVTVEYD